MTKDYSTRFTAWSFIAAAALLWGGWMLLPVHIGAYFEQTDFARVHDQFYYWIWTYRIHLFGMVVTASAFGAMAALLTPSPSRVMVWPGAAVATAGMIVSALGAAFYYHHGAWGAMEMLGKSAVEIDAFIASLRNDTEFVTCLVRFGRVFTGLGLMVFGLGLKRWKVLPAWLCWMAAALGMAAMALTMIRPDQWSLYLPVFHIQSFWLLAVGIVILRSGVRIEE